MAEEASERLLVSFQLWPYPLGSSPDFLEPGLILKGERLSLWGGAINQPVRLLYRAWVLTGPCRMELAGILHA